MFSVPDDLPEDTKRRLPEIMEGVQAGKSNAEIAAELGVSKFVVDNDRLLWKRSAGWEIWVEEEFQRLHEHVSDTNPETAYKVMGQLMKSIIGLKIKAEIMAKGKITFNVKPGESIEAILGEYEDAIAEIAEKVTERIVQRDDPGESVDPPSPPS